MATDREAAKNAILSSEDTDPELDETLHEAKDLRIDAIREANRHDEAKTRIRQGLFGFLGARESAPYNIAFLAVCLSFFGFFVCLIAYGLGEDPKSVEFFGNSAERSIVVALTALAYIFGRSGSPG